jgi:predicted RNase H-like HicB family nuclease
MAKRAFKVGPLTIRAGDLVLDLKPAKEGGFIVTSPFDPQLVTEADTIEEAIANANDASEALKLARAKRGQPLRTGSSSATGRARNMRSSEG